MNFKEWINNTGNAIDFINKVKGQTLRSLQRSGQQVLINFPKTYAMMEPMSIAASVHHAGDPIHEHLMSADKPAAEKAAG